MADVSLANITADSAAGFAWPDFAVYRPHPGPGKLIEGLAQAQSLTRTLARGHEDAAVPCIPIVNPPLWELGHMAWFQEFWVLRGGSFENPSLLPDADRWYDSARIPHDARWKLDLPDVAATLRYGDEVLSRVQARLREESVDDRLAYFAQLALFHQDMHNEAFCYMWQTLGFAMPVDWPTKEISAAEDLTFAAAAFSLGARPGGFVFDNEKWAHEVELPAYTISRSPVSNAEFRTFVDAGGYARREFWSDAGWALREQLSLAHPRYWRRPADAWQLRRFDRWLPLPGRAPVMHISAHEAEAYCRWAKRRLPSEAEWEHAARASGGFEYGQVWEWTSSAFLPYPGFATDPYREYSAPWFTGDYRVLRGGSLVTPRRLMRPTWRNFYKPERADLFCGFRTCATGAGAEVQ